MIAPEELRNRQQWLLWRFEPNPKKPTGKKLKVPYYINGKRRMGTQGDEKDRTWLSNFNAVLDMLTRSRSTRLPFDGIGFAFLPGDGLIGIDLDGMIDADGVVSDRGREIIKASSTYTELSPSKKGVHIIGRGKVAKSFKSNDIGVEVFCGSQYFTFTGEHYSGSPEVINDIPDLTLKRLETLVAKAKGQADASRPAPAAPMNDERAKVESALAVLSPDCDYDTWLHIGMAIHAALGDGGLTVWDYWSGKGGKYRGFKDLESHWRSFKPGGGITAATLFKFAKDAGWRAPRVPRAAPPTPGRSGEAGNAQPPAGGRGDSSGGEADPPNEGLPLIRVKQGMLPQAVDLAEEALLAFPERIYQRSGFITRVVKRDRPSVRNYKVPAGSLGVHTVDQNYLLELFNRAACWEKWNVKIDDWVRCHCPDQVASFYLARTGRWKLPRLWSVISAPTLRPDGTVLQKPGYDEATCTFYDPCGIKFPVIPDEPTREQAEAALKALQELFKSFPFEQEQDRAVALSLALTALVRRALPSAPLGAVSAPVMASGKTLLADCIAILATGVSAPAMTYPEREEEAEKTALSVLMEGDPVVMIDNVERPLQGAWLCSILTQEVYQQRVLGRSEMMRVPTTTLWLATGNQLVVAGDLRTRTLLCRIDPKSEHPEQRAFGGDLREWTTSNRPRLVAAGLTLIRAFIANGTPVADVCKPWGRFERWSEMVRAPLIWLGCEDPCGSLASLEGDDPERNELARMLAAWRACFGTEPTSAREAVERTLPPAAGLDSDAKLLNDVLKEIASERGGGLSVRRLGKWLQKHGGRRIGGWFFTKASERDHVALWKVEPTDKGGTATATG